MITRGNNPAPRLADFGTEENFDRMFDTVLTGIRGGADGPEG